MIKILEKHNIYVKKLYLMIFYIKLINLCKTLRFCEKSMINVYLGVFNILYRPGPMV